MSLHEGGIACLLAFVWVVFVFPKGPDKNSCVRSILITYLSSSVGLNCSNFGLMTD